jgi:GT2 family glycosyltransferase
VNGKWQYCFNNFPGAMLAIKDVLFISTMQRAIFKFRDAIGKWNKPRRVGYIDGAVIAVARDTFRKVGGFDETYFFYTEETDFCRKLKQIGKHRIVYPKAKVMHYRGGSSGSPLMKEKNIRMQVKSQIYFCEKWLPDYSRYVFIHLDKYMYLFHSWIHKLILTLTGSNTKAHKRMKINMLRDYFRIWKESVKQIKKSQ